MVLDVAGAGAHAFLYWSLLTLLVHSKSESKILIWERGGVGMNWRLSAHK